MFAAIKNKAVMKMSLMTWNFNKGVLLITAIMIFNLIKVATGMEGIVETLAGGGLPHIGDVDTCVDESSSLDGNLFEARFNYPWGITYDRENQVVYVADCGCPGTTKENDLIRKIDLQTRTVTTIAGSTQGHQDGHMKQARFAHVAGMAVDNRQQVLYIADVGNDVIRMLKFETNLVATFAGKAREGGFEDGPLEKARFMSPQQLEVVESTNIMYVGDTENHAIRAIDLNKRPPMVSTLSGGPDKQGLLDGKTQEAKWYRPTGITFDSRRNALYVSDHYNHAIRKIDLDKGEVTTIAGNGSPGHFSQNIATTSLLHYPEGIVYDHDNDVIYFAEFLNNCVRMITLADNKVQVLAGGGIGIRNAVGEDAQFYHPTSLDFDPVRKVLYVTDQYNHRIRTVTTLGNIQEGHPNMMVKKHLGRLDAYRDIAVHENVALKVLIYAMVLLTLIIAFIFGRRFFLRHDIGHCYRQLKTFKSL